MDVTLMKEAAVLLANSGCQLSAHVPTGGEMRLTPDQAVQLVTDKIGFWANHFNATREQVRVWLEWIDECYAMEGDFCRGTTKRGARCRQRASREMYATSPKDFRPGMDDYCRLHWDLTQ